MPDAESALGETLSLEGLIASAEQDVAAKKAKLAADAAELAAASQAAGSPTPAPRPPPAAASKETVQLKLSGPLMQVPETVLRVFHLYEEKHVQPLLQRLTLLRWWMRRWSWLSHVTRRARLRIEIKVLETEVLETEIEILRREVGSILLQRDPVQECNHKVRMLRERKVKERIRTFRIKRLAAWAGDLDTDPQAPEPKDDERFRAALKDCERFRAARFFQDDFVPMFDLRNSKTWKFGTWIVGFVILLPRRKSVWRRAHLVFFLFSNSSATKRLARFAITGTDSSARTMQVITLSILALDSLTMRR